MKVIATNKGKAVEINYHGKIVKTGIYKYPVSEGIVLENCDVKNDEVIDRRYHGGLDKACYCYGVQHYEFWKKRFPDLDWTYGMFGENLSITNFKESEILIGDVFEVGECLVQVSQPRQPCYKLNYRFKSDTMVKQFIESGFSGIYLRVLRGGKVKPGDELILKERNEKSLSVEQVYRLLYESEKNQQLLNLALKDVALAEACKQDLQK